MQVAAVILAAGASTRFGSQKQLARLASGRTMLEEVVEIARAAGLDPIIAVVPPGLAVPPDVVPERNSAPEAGISHSLRLGLGAVPAEVAAAVILLGDQPTVRPEVIGTILAAARGDRPVVAAHASGRSGPPVLIMRPGFDLADQARGDEGLRSIVAASPELVTSVEVGQHAPDVDTPGDLAALGEGESR